MSELLRSFVLGTSGLTIVAGIAVLLTAVRAPRSTEGARRVARLVPWVVVAQAAHVAEEYASAFHVEFPAWFGLRPWPAVWFLSFNGAWLAIWLASAVGVARGVRAAWFPVWFLGLGTLVGGVAHPALSGLIGRAFPGVWTSVPCAVLGAWLCVAAARATTRRVPGGVERDASGR